MKKAKKKLKGVPTAQLVKKNTGLIFTGETLRVSHYAGHDRTFARGPKARMIVFSDPNVNLNRHEIRQLGERLIELARDLDEEATQV